MKINFTLIKVIVVILVINISFHILFKTQRSYEYCGVYFDKNQFEYLIRNYPNYAYKINEPRDILGILADTTAENLSNKKISEQVEKNKYEIKDTSKLYNILFGEDEENYASSEFYIHFPQYAPSGYKIKPFEKTTIHNFLGLPNNTLNYIYCIYIILISIFVLGIKKKQK